MIQHRQNVIIQNESKTAKLHFIIQNKNTSKNHTFFSMMSFSLSLFEVCCEKIMKLQPDSSVFYQLGCRSKEQNSSA